MRKTWMYCLLCLLSVSIAFGQTAQLNGIVLNDRSQPVPSASVHLLNTYVNTVTDSAGRFTINAVGEGRYMLEITCIGYASAVNEVTISANTANTLTIRLSDASVQLDEVVVGAQKKEERLRDVPISVTMLSAKDITNYRLWASKDLAGISPNLYVANPGDGRNVVSIRGITSTSYDPAVTTYIDGVSQFSLDTYIPQLFDIEKIEILKGPQSTLYGRNALGGVINITTQQPSNKPDGYAEISVGNFGTQRYTAAVRAPLIKNKLYFGAAALYEGMQGYYTNDHNNSHFDKQHRIGGNYYLRYVPAPQWTIGLNVKHLANRNNGAFPLAASIGDALSHPYHLDQNSPAEMADNTLNTSLVIQRRGDGINFSSQTAYQSNYRYYKTPLDGDFSPIDGVTVVNNFGPGWNKVKVLTQEIKINSAGSSPLQWTTGAYFFYQHIPNKQGTHFGEDAQYVGSPDINYTLINTTVSRNTGIAAYGQINYAISPSVHILAGLRYEYQYSRAKVNGAYQPDGGSLIVIRPDTSGTTSFNAFSPMLSLQARLHKSVNVYLSYTRGNRAGGLTPLSSDPSFPPLYAYKPEYSRNYEAGLKTAFFNNKLFADLALFYTVISDVQVPTLLLPDAITVTRNTGKLHNSGMDISVNAIPLKRWEIGYSLGYTHSKYKNLKVASNGAEVDLGGNRQVYSPDITSLLASQYALPVNRTGALQLTARAEWLYIGKTYFDLANNLSQSPYSLLNAKLGLITPHVRFDIWVRNLADTKYITYAYDFGAAYLGNPRTFGGTVRITL